MGSSGNLVKSLAVSMITDMPYRIRYSQIDAQEVKNFESFKPFERFRNGRQLCESRRTQEESQSNLSRSQDLKESGE